MQVLRYAVCVLLLYVTVSAAGTTSSKISNAERAQVRKAFEEGARITTELQRATDINPIAQKIPRSVSGILSGVGTFIKLLGLFQPKDNSIEDEMKKGFDRVVGKLDDIESTLEDILKEIKIAEYRGCFMMYQLKIELMGSILEEIINAPNKSHGIDKFKRAYDQQYGYSGKHLVTLIVRMNMLKVAVKYTENHRPQMVKFMRTLLSLLLKASIVEVAYEKFNNRYTGVLWKWKSSFSDVSNTMMNIDRQLVRDWKKYFVKDVDNMASKLRYKNHRDFSNGMYNFFKGKYPWRHWFVLSYNPLSGSDEHHVVGNGDTIWKFRYYGKRNFMVSSTSPSAKFNHNVAVPANVGCHDRKGNCKAKAAVKVYGATRRASAATAVIQRSAGWSWRADTYRVATRSSTLQWRFRFWGVTYKKDWPMKIVYFG